MMVIVNRHWKEKERNTNAFIVYYSLMSEKYGNFIPCKIIMMFLSIVYRGRQ